MINNTHMLTPLMLAASLLAGSAWGQMSISPLELAGDVNNTSYSTGGVAPNLFNSGELQLDSIDRFSVIQDDTFDVVLTLTNGPFVVPASTQTLFGLSFNGPNQPVFFDGGAPVVDGMVRFKLVGVTVAELSGSCGNCATLITVLQPNTSLSFDQVDASLRFSNLLSSYVIENASIRYQATTPVPEPATWAMLLGGLAALSAWSRKRQAPLRRLVGQSSGLSF